MNRISEAGDGAPVGATAAKSDDLYDGLRKPPASGPDVTSSQGVILDIESIEWVSVKDALPDSETTVLVYAPGSDEPVWLGFYDDVFWFAVNGAGYGDPDEIAAEVTAWAPGADPEGARMSAADPFMPKLVRRGLRPIGELAATRPHGHRLRYMAGCKCFKCRRSNSDYERMRQAARLAGDWNGIVDAVNARRHLRWLSRAGVGQWSVVAATDICRSMIHEIKNGDRRRIRARTERKILAVNLDQRSDQAKVPAARAWRLIDELLEEGFNKAGLAKLLGYRSPALQLRRDRITARNEQRVIALHRRLTT